MGVMDQQIARLKRSTRFTDDYASEKSAVGSRIIGDHASSNIGQERQSATSRERLPPPPLPLTARRLLDSSETYHRPPIPVQVMRGSPWVSYERKWTMELGGQVVVVARRLPLDAPEDKRSAKYAIKTIGKDNRNQALLNINQLQDKSIVKTHEIFDHSDDLHIISECMSISLLHVCRCRRYPTNAELLAIIAQVSTVIQLQEDEQ